MDFGYADTGGDRGSIRSITQTDQAGTKTANITLKKKTRLCMITAR
jgi:hypothetical protein